MNNLVKETETITSIEVAEMVEKPHNDLMKDIRRYIGQMRKGNISQSDFFSECSYKNQQNHTLPCFNVTKKGCEFIAHKLTGVKGTAFTAKYINRFHEMEETIKNNKEDLSLEELNIIKNYRFLKDITAKRNELQNIIDQIDSKIAEINSVMPIKDLYKIAPIRIEERVYTKQGFLSFINSKILDWDERTEALYYCYRYADAKIDLFSRKTDETIKLINTIETKEWNFLYDGLEKYLKEKEFNV